VFRRQQVRSHSDLMREEFGEGFDHLRMAAAHAAGTAAGLIAPRLDIMRERLEPSFDKSKNMARESARRANKVARRATGKKEARMAKRWPMVVGGLMVAGVAAGAVGALLSRRRQRRWNDYGTTGTTTTLSGIRDDTRATASSIADTAKEKTSDVLGQMKGTTETTGTAKANPSPMASSTTTRTGDFGTQAETYKPSSSSTGSRNSRP
jgi:hypothetical protein